MRFKLLRHPRLLDVCVALVAAYAVYLFIGQVDDHYPIEHWLFWRYARCWAASAFWALSVLVAGHRALTFVRGGLLPVREQLVLSFATGVLLFFFAMFVGGALKLYGGFFFFELPLLLLAAGWRSAYRYARRLRRHLAAARQRTAARAAIWVKPVLAFGFLSLLAVYLPLLLPENLSYDSRWYHMAIGEQYAAAGGIFRQNAGWLLGTYPHLASYVYAWAFQMPGVSLFDRVELAQHLELVLFLATLVSVPALVRALLTRVRSPHSWVALFLFPGVLIYDSSLNGGADHVAAFWAIPLYLTLLRCWRGLSPTNAGLFAAMVGGALNTKYSAVAIVAGPLLLFGLRLLLSVWPRRAGAWVRPWPALAAAGAALLIVLIVTAPHWAKNWFWYGDPVYPLLQGKLQLRPWSSEATRQFAALQTGAWRPTRDMAGLQEGLKVLYNFSYVPHDWETMHGKVPVFGSLFTLTTLLLPFVWRGRVWGLYGATLFCVFTWFWVQHEDRYLQGLVPLMAAGTAAVLVHLWGQRGAVARLGLASLVGMQVVWGGDIFFFPAHQMIGGAPLKALVEHISSGFNKDYKRRVSPYVGNVAIGKQLPKGAVLLLHESHDQLGLGVATIQDSTGFQGGLYYTESTSPAALARKLAEMGASHVLWRSASIQSSSIAEDLVFYDFVTRHTSQSIPVSGFNVSKLTPKVADERPFGDAVGFYGCRARDGFAYEPGLYHLRDLNITYLERRPGNLVPKPYEPAPEGALIVGQLERADFVVINSSCHDDAASRLKPDFTAIGSLKQLGYWVRKTSP
jgi:hypothetical protein